jgi:anti-sigma-K factor RskA
MILTAEQPRQARENALFTAEECKANSLLFWRIHVTVAMIIIIAIPAAIVILKKHLHSSK